MHRPWHEDDRPAWRVVASWVTSQGSLDEGGQALLLKTLEETGLVAGAVVEAVADGRLRLAVLVKAPGGESAEYAADRIVRVAYRVAGLGDLGLCFPLSAQLQATPGGLGAGE